MGNSVAFEKLIFIEAEEFAASLNYKEMSEPYSCGL